MTFMTALKSEQARSILGNEFHQFPLWNELFCVCATQITKNKNKKK